MLTEKKLPPALSSRKSPARLSKRNSLRKWRKEKHLKLILSQAQKIGKIGTWYFNQSTRLVWLSDEMHTIHEIENSHDTYHYRSVLDLFRSPYKESFVAASHLLFEKKIPFDITALCFTPAGNKRWVRVVGHPDIEKGNVKGIIGITFDITEVKQAEELLQASEQKFIKTFQNSPDSMGIVREEDMVIIDVNTKLIPLVGYSKEELIGKHATDLSLFVNPAHRDLFFNKYLLEGYAEIETVWRKKNGETVEVLIRSSRIIIQGKYFGVFFIKDISARKLNRQRLLDIFLDEAEIYTDKKGTGEKINKQEKLISSLQPRPCDQAARLILPTSEGFIFLKPCDIMYCEAQSNYTRFHLTGGRKYTVSKTLKGFENSLPADVFLRIHNSYIINVNYIKKYNKGEGTVVMEDDALLDVSKRKKDFFHSRMGIKK